LVGLFCTSTLGIQLKCLVSYVTDCREIETPGGNFKIKGPEREIRVKGSTGIEADILNHAHGVDSHKHGFVETISLLQARIA